VSPHDNPVPAGPQRVARGFTAPERGRVIDGLLSADSTPIENPVKLQALASEPWTAESARQLRTFIDQASRRPEPLCRPGIDGCDHAGVPERSPATQNLQCPMAQARPGAPWMGMRGTSPTAA